MRAMSMPLILVPLILVSSWSAVARAEVQSTEDLKKEPQVVELDLMTPEVREDLYGEPQNRWRVADQRAILSGGGQVLDRDGEPAEGVEVISVGPEFQTEVMTTGADGHFAPKEPLVFDETSEDFLENSANSTFRPRGLIARRGGDVAVSTQFSIGSRTLILGEGHASSLVVTDAGKPVARAKVGLHVPTDLMSWAAIGYLETDERGRLDLPTLPAGSFKVAVLGPDDRRALASLTFPEDADETLALELEPGRRIRIRVVDELDDTPIAGVQVFVQEMARAEPRDRDFEVPTAAPCLAHPILPTDEDGWMEIRGVDPEQEMSALVITRSARGFPSFEGAQLLGDTTIRISQPRPHIIPVEDWCGSVPDDGTPVLVNRIGYSSGYEKQLKAEVRDGALAMATAPFRRDVEILLRMTDGRWAVVRHDAEKGKTTHPRFSRPCQIGALVRETDGEPLAGVRLLVKMSNQGLLAEALTDAKGRVVFEQLPGVQLEVIAAKDGTPARHFLAEKTVDLSSRNSAEIELEVAPMIEARAQVVFDGGKSLPDDLVVSSEHCVIEYQTIDAEQNEVAFGFRSRVPPRLYRFFFTIPTRASSQGVVEIDEEGKAKPLVITMQSWVRLRARVDRGDLGAMVAIQRWSKEGRWQSFNEGRIPLAPKSPFVINELAAGRYRLFDRMTGLVSSAVEVEPGGLGELHLDLRSVALVKGQVRCPEGDQLTACRILVTFEGQDESFRESQRIHGRNQVAADGSFELPVPLGRPVTLEAWHPFLTTDKFRGRRSFIESPESIVLELVWGNFAWFQLEGSALGQLHRFAPGQWKTILWPRGRGEVIQTTAYLSEGEQIWFGKFEPGRYDVWINLAPYAPLVFENLALSEGNLNYGSRKISRRSTLDCEFHWRDGSDAPPTLTALARRIDGPEEKRFERKFDFDSNRRGLIYGLGKGRFEISFRADFGRKQWVIEIDLDGESSYLLPLEMR